MSAADSSAWACPDDGSVLRDSAEATVCSGCGASFEIDGESGAPVFAGSATERERANARPQALDELWRSLERQPPERALDDLAAAHGCVRSPTALDWKRVIAVRRDDSVVEIAAGGGDDTLDLARRARSVTTLVPTRLHAGLLARRFAGAATPAAQIGIVTDLRRLPLGDGRADLLAVKSESAAAFGLRRGDVAQAVDEWKRVVAPGGRVFVGLPNRPAARVMQTALGALGISSGTRSLETLLSGAGEGPTGLPGVVRRMSAAGFGAPVEYAPIPGPDSAEIVLPLGDPRALRYFLGHLVRKNAAAVRGALSAADLLLRTDLLRRAVPYRYFVFARP
ncbi:MAG: methyltransferase domain-containing protein [bacterium]|nr:methyltransferase domain-containing protein [bacterium]